MHKNESINLKSEFIAEKTSDESETTYFNEESLNEIFEFQISKNQKILDYSFEGYEGNEYEYEVKNKPTDQTI